MSRTSKTSARLSAADLTAVEAARAAARKRFAHVADADDVPGEPDPDNPPMTDEQLASLQPAADVVPGLLVASLRRRGGRPKSEAPKVAVSIRLDADVVEALRLSGEGWQSRTNEMLRWCLGLRAPVRSEAEDIAWVENIENVVDRILADGAVPFADITRIAKSVLRHAETMEDRSLP